MIKMLASKYDGFTLIELMIVVAIIGLLASIAIPNFMKFQCKAKQVEAKTNLGFIRSLELGYEAEYNKYSANTTFIGFHPKGETRYSYSIKLNSAGYDATAIGNSSTQISGDTWTINQEGNLINLPSACN